MSSTDILRLGKMSFVGRMNYIMKKIIEITICKIGMLIHPIIHIVPPTSSFNLFEAIKNSHHIILWHCNKCNHDFITNEYAKTHF